MTEINGLSFPAVALATIPCRYSLFCSLESSRSALSAAGFSVRRALPTRRWLRSPEQLAEAIPTLNAGAQQAARSDPRQCRVAMGFITVATPGNPAGGTVSLRTSKYQSPPFHVTDRPQRIAVPNPLPETGGVDLFSADGDAKG